MEVFEAIRNRCAVRQSKHDIMPCDILLKILEAARWATSLFNTRTWGFIIIRDKETLKSISKYAKYSGYLEAAMAVQNMMKVSGKTLRI